MTFVYSEHQDSASLDQGIRKGDFLKGKYRVNRNNPNEGVITTTFGFEVKIIGKSDNNRAILGDQVAVKLLDESKWLTNKTVDIQDDDQAENETRLSTSTMEDKRYKSLRDKIIKENITPVGVIVGVVKRDLRNLAGQVSRCIKATPEKSFVLVDPVDPRFPSTVLTVRNFEQIKTKKISFSIDNWPESQAYPSGHLVGIFGEADDMNTESKVILFEHNVETRQFSQAVLDCLPKEGANYKITDEELKKRQDLRNYPIVNTMLNSVFSRSSRLQRYR
jgi:exoribonuclease R